MKVLSQVKVLKLKEYSRSYGGLETVEYAFLKEDERFIYLYTSTGHLLRKMQKGTKVLKSWSGKEISERTFKARVNKALKEKADSLAASETRFKTELNQIISWSNWLYWNPDKKQKYRAKKETMQGSNYRNFLRMKFAKHLNEGSFDGMEVSGSQLMEILFAD